MSDAFSIPPDIVCLADYERHARGRLSEGAWAYVAGGAADETTLRRNREAFDAILLKGRVLGDLGGGNTRLVLFGETYEHPIMLAPVAHHGLACPAAEIATAVGAVGARAGFVISTEADTAIEEIAAAATGGNFWFQLYIQHDRDFTHALVERATRAGAKAIVLTADAPVSGVRDRERRAGVTPAILRAPVNLRDARPGPVPRAGLGESLIFNGFIDSAARWEDFARLRAATRLPLLIKGIMAPEDADRAIGEGADGIVVSNHGGRVLDTLPATMEALPVIASAVAGRVPVLVDGGIRRGTDVLKALACGASAVMIGRPYIHALAVAGPAGVAHAVQMLRGEFEVAMALTGCRTLRDVSPRVLWEATRSGQAGSSREA
ncbi:alpha-hydroxy-acid oxidizing protein [Roseomonas eburnea]|uniref:Alpha-hydroxy-acid oxidizing protein n=1 Tax=Neoroseomonas eburnea TaxID=1346889 RepID=A0A9X9X9S4_9PROT|nr:alpha-hydroxy acid oxidase [Neoroseomonas eburnea]MBR0680460.1 alpha-hydroxy-acid oxidizing protein [Neoroseomonas eburnea]